MFKHNYLMKKQNQKLMLNIFVKQYKNNYKPSSHYQYMKAIFKIFMLENLTKI